jgi:trimeric autotransporter adhesin
VISPDCTADWTGLVAQGFEALSELDDNHDGVVDVTDAAWSDLLLWVDRDHDGKSAGELTPIAESTVFSL